MLNTCIFNIEDSSVDHTEGHALPLEKSIQAIVVASTKENTKGPRIGYKSCIFCVPAPWLFRYCLP